jgi:hypothetical protein
MAMIPIYSHDSLKFLVFTLVLVIGLVWQQLESLKGLSLCDAKAGFVNVFPEAKTFLNTYFVHRRGKTVWRQGIGDVSVSRAAAMMVKEAKAVIARQLGRNVDVLWSQGTSVKEEQQPNDDPQTVKTEPRRSQLGNQPAVSSQEGNSSSLACAIRPPVLAAKQKEELKEGGNAVCANVSEKIVVEASQTGDGSAILEEENSAIVEANETWPSLTALQSMEEYAAATQHSSRLENNQRQELREEEEDANEEAESLFEHSSENVVADDLNTSTGSRRLESSLANPHGSARVPNVDDALNTAVSESMSQFFTEAEEDPRAAEDTLCCSFPVDTFVGVGEEVEDSLCSESVMKCVDEACGTRDPRDREDPAPGEDLPNNEDPPTVEDLLANENRPTDEDLSANEDPCVEEDLLINGDSPVEEDLYTNEDPEAEEENPPSWKEDAVVVVEEPSLFAELTDVQSSCISIGGSEAVNALQSSCTEKSKFSLYIAQLCHVWEKRFIM